jgi:Domain of unknown function (DUF4920)
MVSNGVQSKAQNLATKLIGAASPPTEDAAIYLIGKGDTMKKVVSIVFLLLFCFSATAFSKTTTYGKDLTVEETTKISQIIETPEKFIGKKIKISGMIIEVCASRGCWVYIASDKQYEKIQVKVTDGEIVFPMSASGRMAEVEGIVEELKMSKNDLIKWKRHQAQERGQDFDPASVTGDEKIIRLIGLGAVIEE